MGKGKLRACDLCGAKVRDENVLAHRDRVHPNELRPEEREAVGLLNQARAARRAERERLEAEERARLEATERAGRQAEEAGERRREHGLPDEDEEVDGEEEDEDEYDDEEDDDEAEVPERFRLPPALESRVKEVRALLRSSGVRRRSTWLEEELQQKVEESYRRRWRSVASRDPDLVEAREKLFDADLRRFKKNDQGGYEERRAALSAPLKTLSQAGEAGVPHLGMALMCDSWASVLAVEALAGMDPGPLRNRAIVEALFVEDDWLPETAEEEVRRMPWDDRWAALETVARHAHERGIELQSLYWTGVLDRGPKQETLKFVPGPAIEKVLLLLYDLSHMSALRWWFDMHLDPTWDGPEWVERFLGLSITKSILKVIENRPPGQMPEQPPPSEEAECDVCRGEDSWIRNRVPVTGLEELDEPVECEVVFTEVKSVDGELGFVACAERASWALLVWAAQGHYCELHAATLGTEIERVDDVSQIKSSAAVGSKAYLVRAKEEREECDGPEDDSARCWRAARWVEVGVLRELACEEHAKKW